MWAGPSANARSMENASPSATGRLEGPGTLDGTGQRSAKQLLRQAPGDVVFILWVSVCAFIPEAIWQGLWLLKGHLGPTEIYSALFIGTLFTFFVEPLLERLRAGRWRLAHGPGGNLVLTASVALGFGMVAVSIHHSIDAYLGGAVGGADARQAALAHAMQQTQEWASLPAAVMAAWFLANIRRRLAYPALYLACLWCFGAGVLYAWRWQEVLATAIPCCLIALLGTRAVLAGWTPKTVSILVKIVGAVAVCWLSLVWVVGWAINHAGYPNFEFYEPAQLAEDARFYLGWGLGLCVAPNPVTEEARRPV